MTARRDRYGEPIDDDETELELVLESTGAGGEPCCDNGWRGDIDNPEPCPIHKPHLRRRYGAWELINPATRRPVRGQR